MTLCVILESGLGNHTVGAQGEQDGAGGEAELHYGRNRGRGQPTEAGMALQSWSICGKKVEPLYLLHGPIIGFKMLLGRSYNPGRGTFLAKGNSQAEIRL